MIEFSKILPNLLQQDQFSKCLAIILDTYLEEINQVYDSLFIMRNLDYFNDRILDEIAKDKSIVWYDSALPIDKKRNIIKSHRLVFRTLGTEKAVKQLLKDYFGDEAYIENWYDYGATPHKFRIIFEDLPFNISFLDFYTRFSASLNWVKSADTWLDGVIINRKVNIKTFAGTLVNTAKNIIVNTDINKDYNINLNLFTNIIANKFKYKNVNVKTFSEQSERVFLSCINLILKKETIKEVTIPYSNSKKFV